MLDSEESGSEAWEPRPELHAHGWMVLHFVGTDQQPVNTGKEVSVSGACTGWLDLLAQLRVGTRPLVLHSPQGGA